MNSHHVPTDEEIRASAKDTLATIIIVVIMVVAWTFTVICIVLNQYPTNILGGK